MVKTNVYLYLLRIYYILYFYWEEEGELVNCVSLIDVYDKFMSNLLILRWIKTNLEDEKARSLLDYKLVKYGFLSRRI